MSLLAFQMWEPTRQTWMAEHRFYFEQARKRLLTQFDNIEAEANKAAEEYLKQTSRFFNPDSDDVGDFYESANDKGIEFYLLLRDMLERTRLSVIAGMYHEWDKKLREWLTKELRSWHHGDNLVRAIWKADISSVFDLLLVLDFDASAVTGYERLDAMRLVVNVFKHGDGTSLDQLKEKYPEFVLDPIGGDDEYRSHFLDHTNMKVTEGHLEEFSAAILGFWQAVPKEMWVKQEEVEVPMWFEKAYLKDRAEHERA
ncbi:hypothetical protein FB547_10915 [Variovorax beijingensis]|uniref:Uncharacterized protein n=1 Tax=Variovorax beijingensis TaxID=2496117 RepID=A0A561BF23_9BURK|nr:hypothetical protein [Variovorax beijingensis]TWD77481.1 hypothetical protein FB547_10915 [Variovorax beijingensis]